MISSTSNHKQDEPRKIKAEKLVIASHNPGKVTEISSLLFPFNIDCIPVSSFDLEEPIEDGNSFSENAKIKALAAAKKTQIVSLADDSGLCINALAGDPGIHSARWAGPSKDFKYAISQIEIKMRDLQDKSAFFVCALAVAWPDGQCQIYEGRVDGELVFPPRGTLGFGYDSIFTARGMTETFGEIHPKQKDAISHRGQAFFQFQEACIENNNKHS